MGRGLLVRPHIDPRLKSRKISNVWIETSMWRVCRFCFYFFETNQELWLQHDKFLVWVVLAGDCFKLWNEKKNINVWYKICNGYFVCKNLSELSIRFCIFHSKSFHYKWMFINSFSFVTGLPKHVRHGSTLL